MRKQLVAIALVALTVVPLYGAKPNKGKGQSLGRGGTTPATSSSAGPDNPSGGQEPGLPTCTHYAAPANATPPGTSGNPGTSAAPFRIQDFWSVSGGPQGKVLCLKDGEYTGSAYMLTPTNGLSGTSDINRIIIRAEHDGLATINGEFFRNPIDFKNNSWYLVQGINAKNGMRYVAIIGDGVDCRTGPGSNNNIFRRLMLWDVDPNQNTTIVEHCFANNNRWEDYGVFGMGSRSFHVYIGSNNTFVRPWARFEGMLGYRAGPNKSFQIGYGSNGNVNNVVLDGLFTWWAGSMPQQFSQWNWGVNDGASCTPTPCNNGTVTNYNVTEKTGPYFSEMNPDDTNAQMKVYGGISYLRAGDSIGTGSPPPSQATQMLGIRWGSNMTLKDVLVIVPSSLAGASSILGFNLGTGDPGNVSNSAINVSSIISGSNALQGGWSISNSCGGGGTSICNATTLTGLNSLNANPWTGTAGANLCKRHDGANRTTVPLWPWPMNQRIKDALTAAGQFPIVATGQSPFTTCVNCTGGRLTRNGTADVTADIETLLGTIPPECKG